MPPDPIDLSTHDAIIVAAARALQLGMDIRAGRPPTDEEACWLADTAYAALLNCRVPATVPARPALAAELDELLPEPPPWLRRMQEDFNS